MTSVYGQTDALALDIAERINNISATLCLTVNAERRFRLLDILPNIPAVGEPVSVGLYPDEERSERLGISTAFSSLYAVHLYIQQQVSGAVDEESQCALLTRLRSEILDDLRSTLFVLAQAVHPVEPKAPKKKPNENRCESGTPPPRPVSESSWTAGRSAASPAARWPS